VHYKFPHPIKLSVVNIKDEELKKVIRVSLTDDFINLNLVGFGFRVDILVSIVFFGIELKIDFHESGEYVSELIYNAELLDSNLVYSVATVYAFIFGMLLPGIARAEEKDLLLPDFIRNILSRTLLKHFSK